MANIGGLALNRSIVASISRDPVGTAVVAKKFGADILELRIDLLDSDARQTLLDLKSTGMPVIITNRMKQEGGAWTGSEKERIRVLVSLLPLADAIDVELCAEERDFVIKSARRAGKTIIISTHDFQRTPEPGVMAEIIKSSFEAGADIAKLAVMPNSLEDVLHLLEVTLRAKGAVCTIAMGEVGRHSRVIAPVYGSVLTYGYVDKATAPGQLRVDELRSILRML